MCFLSTGMTHSILLVNILRTEWLQCLYLIFTTQFIDIINNQVGSSGNLHISYSGNHNFLEGPTESVELFIWLYWHDKKDAE